MNNNFKTIELVVTNNENCRLDKYLLNNLELIDNLKTVTWSRTKIQELIKSQQVTVNNVVVSSNYLVKLDDVIKINYLIKAKFNLTPNKKEQLNIVYEDDSLIVINKPKNLVVHPAPGNYQDTLVNILIGHQKQLAPSLEDRPGIVHRIDKDTSGLLLIAKTSFVQDQLSQQLQAKSVRRKYFVLVYGIIKENKGIINAPIGRDARDRKKMAVTSKNSRLAVTHFQVLERFNDYTLIECSLETGRTHQIRVHLNYIKHPVVGDHKYGYAKDLKETNKQYLHAYYLEFIHPVTKKVMKLEIGRPAEFEKRLQQLRREVEKNE